MASTYEPIATTTVSTATTQTVTFSSISGSYTDLILVCGDAGVTASDFTYRMRLNSDTGNNYSFTELYGLGSSAASARDSNRSNIPLNYYPVLANNNSANIIVNFMNYSNTTTYKTCLVRENAAASGTGAIVGLWRSTSAITSITIDNLNTGVYIKQNATFTLYGIKAA